jgi:hypothetical protein
MDEETQKIIEEQMKILPADVKTAIISVDYKKKLEEITKRQRLMIDQAGKLEMETTLVMIGLEPLADYIDNIVRELGLNEVRAKEVAIDVSDNIFKPIRESLQKMNDDLEEEAGGEETPREEKVDGIGDEVRFTNSNEEGLEREQILNEIENPISNRQNTIIEDKKEETKEIQNEIEIRPLQEIQIRDTPEIKTTEFESKKEETPILNNKLSEANINNKQEIEIKPTIKLPETTEKKVSTTNLDPYREPII